MKSLGLLGVGVARPLPVWERSPWCLLRLQKKVNLETVIIGSGSTKEHSSGWAFEDMSWNDYCSFREPRLIQGRATQRHYC